jgi:hypothetical protein
MVKKEIRDSILKGINSGKKIVLPKDSEASPELHVLSLLWNLALDEGDNVERVDIATQLVRKLPS